MRTSVDGKNFAPELGEKWSDFKAKLAEEFERAGHTAYRPADLERFAQELCDRGHRHRVSLRDVRQWWTDFQNFCNRRM